MRAPAVLILLILLLLAAVAWMTWGGPGAPEPADAGPAPAAGPGPRAAPALPAEAAPARTEDRSAALLLRALLPGGRVPQTARFLLRESPEPTWVEGPSGLAALPRTTPASGAAAFVEGWWSPFHEFSDGERAGAQEIVMQGESRAAALAVRVTDSHGGPLPGWTWSLDRVEGPPGAPEAVEEAGGLYARLFRDAPGSAAGLALDDVPAGVWSVSVRAAEMAPATRSVRLEPGGRGEVVFPLQAGAFVHGKVADESGAPVAGATVLLLPADMGLLEGVFGGGALAQNFEVAVEMAGRTGRARSDGEGAFRLGPAGAGDYRLLAGDEGLLPAMRSEPVTLAAGQEADAGVLVLRRGASLTLEVVAAEDQSPVAGAEVRAFPGVRDENFLGAIAARARGGALRTSADGMVELHTLPPGRVTVEVSAPGRARREAVLEVPPPGATARERVALEVELAIRGVVLDGATRAPVAGAKVRAAAVREGAWFESFLPPEVKGGVEARADSDGAFRVAGLAAGSWQLHVEAEGYARATEGPFAVALGTVEPEATVLLGHGGTLRVLVQDEAGAPRSGVSVSAVNFGAGGGGGQQTDREGLAVFESLPAGDYYVTASRFGEGQDLAALAQMNLGGLQTESTLARVEEGQVTEVVLGGIVARSDVRGFVTRAGAPAAGLSILLMSGGFFQTTRTDDGGYYELEDVPAGEYLFLAGQLQLGGGAGWVGTLTVPGGAAVEFDVELPAAALRVRVLDDRDGRPMAGIPVTLRSRDNNQGGGMLTTDARGEVLFEFLKPDTYVLSAGRGAMAFSLFAAGGEDRASKVVDPVVLGARDGERLVEVRLEQGATLRARVLAPDGSPARGAAVFYLTEAGQPVSPFALAGTGADGWQEVRSLPPGAGRVQARHPRLGSVERSVQLTGGAVTEVELRLEPGTTLRVLVVDRGGVPMRGVQVVALDGRGALVPVVFGQDEIMSAWASYLQGGEQRVGPLAEGRYTLLLVRPGGATVRHEVSVPGGGGEMALRLTYAPER